MTTEDLHSTDLSEEGYSKILLTHYILSYFCHKIAQKCLEILLLLSICIF